MSSSDITGPGPSASGASSVGVGPVGGGIRETAAATADIPPDPSAGTSLYVGNLHPYVTEAMLQVPPILSMSSSASVAVSQRPPRTWCILSLRSWPGHMLQTLISTEGA
jgi:hypothetical protein